MTTLKYKGFRILAMPYQIAQSRRWTVDLEIQRKGRRQLISRDERYRTEQEAEARCTALARRIIDGGVPGSSVDHLREEPAPRLPGILSFLGPLTMALMAVALFVAVVE